jgi:hypothetical protein
VWRTRSRAPRERRRAPIRSAWHHHEST